MKLAFYLTLFLSLVVSFASKAQTEVYGYVTDAQTEEPLAFVNVYFKGTQTGKTTDLKGFYELKSSAEHDTLVISYIGYVTVNIPLKKKSVEEINVALQPDVVTLNEIVVRPGENPAFRIMRKVIAQKKRWDKKKLDAYEYESYTKNEAYIDKMTKSLEEGKLVQKMISRVDSITPLRNKKGQKMIPVFFSENLSRYYWRSNPLHSKEEVMNSRVRGLLVGENTIATQFIGTSFQEYNFYDDWMPLFGKQFVSPIANGWKLYYEYELIDSLMIDGKMHYQLEFFPKEEQNLAFVGVMQIEKGTYALKQIHAHITEAANINYLSGLDIEQQLTIVEQEGNEALMPSRIDVKLDVDPILGVYPGMYIVFSLNYKDFVINKPKPVRFFDIPVSTMQQIKPENEEEFWKEKRHIPLTKADEDVSQMIDDIRDIKIVKTYENLLKVAATGYYELGPVDLGPYPYLFTYNDIEGARFEVGGRTSEKFSEKWEFKGWLGYGTMDEKFKYSATASFFLSKAPWRKFSINHTYDLFQLGLKGVDPDENPFFYASSRFGDLIKPYYSIQNSIRYEQDLRPGFSQSVQLKTETFQPAYDFSYAPVLSDTNSLETGFSTTTLKVGVRFAKGEKFLINGNQKVTVGRNKWPIISMNYSYGFDGFLEGDFEYHQVDVSAFHWIAYDGLGLGKMQFEAGKMFSTVPYPLLKIHTGNQSLFFTDAAFNLMNWFEFVSDSYVSLRYTHYFEGLILNKIPLLKKLKWRLVGVGNIVYGGMSEKNLALTASEFEDKPGFYTLSAKPYAEVGYGVENIFKVLRVDFYHRLTYLDHPNINKFGVRLNIQLIL